MKEVNKCGKGKYDMAKLLHAVQQEKDSVDGLCLFLNNINEDINYFTL